MCRKKSLLIYFLLFLPEITTLNRKKIIKIIKKNENLTFQRFAFFLDLGLFSSIIIIRTSVWVYIVSNAFASYS